MRKNRPGHYHREILLDDSKPILTLVLNDSPCCGRLKRNLTFLLKLPHPLIPSIYWNQNMKETSIKRCKMLQDKSFLKY